MIRGNRILFLMILLGSASVGCSGEDGTGADRVQSFEDAGVPTIEVRDLWSADWPDLPGVAIDTLIGPLDGDDIGLMAPLHAAHLSDGRMVLGDVGSRRVWIETEPGQWREGPGPAEGPAQLRAIGGVWASDAGFVVHDPQTGDLIGFDENGALIDRHRVGSDLARHGAGVRTGPWPSTVQSLGDGNWLVSVATIEVPAEPPSEESQVMEARYTFSRVSGNPAEQEVEIGSGPARTAVLVRGGGGFIPYGTTSYVAGTAGSSVIFGGEEAEVEQVDDAGRVALRVRWADSPRPLDESHRGAMAAFMKKQAPPATPAERLDPMVSRLEEILPYPDVLPHLGDLRLGNDGAIWLGWPERSGLETPTEPELVQEWRVVVPGRGEQDPRIYRVVLPPGTTLLGPTDGGFFLLFRDEIGRQGIGMLRHGGGAP